MIANYHSHTFRCCHAYGTEKEYVEKALERKLRIFGFSDHTPQYFPGDYYSYIRMYPQELPAYCETVRNLQKEYAGRIQIPLGVESEYYPATWKEMLLRLQDAGIEYMILGQHWLDNEQNAHGSAAATADEALMKQYCRQVMTGLETGKFTYLAHPDLFNYVGNRQIYRNHMRQICRLAREGNIPLEINLLGMLCKKHYPNPEFWALAAEEGCSVILGLDAHDPSHVENYECEAKAMEMVRHYGLKLLETVELRNI